MLVELVCQNPACADKGKRVEVFFHSYSLFNEALSGKGDGLCKTCGIVLERLFSGIHPIMGEIPGYEKHNKDHMTMGKAMDMSRSKWF